MLANLLLACPDTVFKYHEHDSLLEKEDDLTEEEKETVWKLYEEQAKINQATLQQAVSQETPSLLDSDPELDSLLNEDDRPKEKKEAVWRFYDEEVKVNEAIIQQALSQETPPFLDSKPKLNEADSFLDQFNGNNSAKTSAADWKSTSSLTSEVMAQPPVQLSPKPSEKSVDNTPPLSFPLLNDGSSVTTNLQPSLAVAHEIQTETSIHTVSSAHIITPSMFSSHSSIVARVPVTTASKYLRNNLNLSNSEFSQKKSLCISQIPFIRMIRMLQSKNAN